MKRYKYTAGAALLALAVSTTTLANSGTISGTKAGTISGTRAGTISGTRAGTISGTRAGTISGTRAGIVPIAPTSQIDSIRFALLDLLMGFQVW